MLKKEEEANSKNTQRFPNGQWEQEFSGLFRFTGLCIDVILTWTELPEIQSVKQKQTTESERVVHGDLKSGVTPVFLFRYVDFGTFLLIGFLVVMWIDDLCQFYPEITFSLGTIYIQIYESINQSIFVTEWTYNVKCNDWKITWTEENQRGNLTNSHCIGHKLRI